MESLIGLIGTLIFIFLILSAVVEMIVELFRGVLEKLGITWVKSKITLEDALKLSTEFAPNIPGMNTKISAVRNAAGQFKSSMEETNTRLEKLQEDLRKSPENIDTICVALNDIAGKVKVHIDQHEHNRIFFLRTISAIIGCSITWEFHFYVFELIASSPDAKAFSATLHHLSSDWINILAGGFAAAAGSSYWHDQLDKIRNIKTLAPM
jgi:hypothetical protein